MVSLSSEDYNVVNVSAQNMSMYASEAPPYVRRLQPTHSAEITPYCSSAPSSLHPPSLCHRHSQKSQPYSQHPHKTWKWMYSPPVVGAECECGRGEGDMASVQEGCESPTLIVYIMNTSWNTAHKLQPRSHVPVGVCVLRLCLLIPALCFVIIFYISEQPQVPKVACLILRCVGVCEIWVWPNVFMRVVWFEGSNRVITLVCVCVCGLAFCTDPKLRLIPPTATPVSTPHTTNQPFWMQGHEAVRFPLLSLHLDHWRWNNRTVFKN